MNGMNKEALVGISTKMKNHKMIMMPVTMMKRKVTPMRKRVGGRSILGVRGDDDMTGVDHTEKKKGRAKKRKRYR